MSFLQSKNIETREAVGVLIRLSSRPASAVTQAPRELVRCSVILCMEVGYSKRNTSFLFRFWLLAHKSPIAGWMAAEADSEIVLSVQDIYEGVSLGATPGKGGGLQQDQMEKELEMCCRARESLGRPCGELLS